MLKGAFIFVVPDADPKKHRATIETPTLSVTMVGVKDFDEAVNVAKSLVEEGIEIIELCPGFGSIGVAKIIEAVGDKVPVGEVYYGIESIGKLSTLFNLK